MSISSEIIIEKDVDNLFKCISQENYIKNNRNKVNISKTKEQLIIKITAKDMVAFRAVNNSICKLLVIFEKTKKI